MHWRRKWQPTPVFLPGESQGRGSLVGCHLWGRTGSDTTEATSSSSSCCWWHHDVSLPSSGSCSNRAWRALVLPSLMRNVQLSSVAQLCPTLCNPMDCSTSGLPVHHQLLQFNQTHVHLVSDAIQQSHPLSSPSPSPFNLSQHHGLF